MVRSNYCTHGNHQVEPHNRCLVPLYWLNTLLGRRIRVGNQVVEANEQMDPKRQTRGWRGQCAGLKWNEPRAWLLAAFIAWLWNSRSFGSVFVGKPKFLGNFHSKALLSMLKKWLGLVAAILSVFASVPWGPVSSIGEWLSSSLRHSMFVSA